MCREKRNAVRSDRDSHELIHELLSRTESQSSNLHFATRRSMHHSLLLMILLLHAALDRLTGIGGDLEMPIRLQRDLDLILLKA